MQEPFRQQSEDFMSWLRAQDGVHISPKIELADFRSRQAGRGVQATQDIEAGEELFCIPHHTIMNVYTSGLRKHAQEVRTLGSWPAAIVTLIFEHGKGESSKWWPYFQVLPETFNTLVYWSSEELAELQGSAVLQKSDKASIERMVDDEILPFVVKHHTLFGTHADAFGGPAGREALLPLVGRMGTLIMAYAFDIEKPEMAEEADEDGYVSDDEEGDSGKGMVPLADMLNADGDEKNNARLEHEDDGVHMVAIKPIPAGSECYNDYGPCPRSDLLRRYGYTSDEYKPHDVVELNLDQIERVMVAKSGLSPKDFEARHMENCVSLQKKMTKILQRTPDCEDSEFLDDTYDIPATITGDSFFDPGLLLTIQALATDPKDNDQLQSMNKAPTRPTSTLVSELLFAILEDRLQEYKTTIAEDQAVLNDDSLPLRRRQAIEVRLGEKEILARAAATVKVAHNDHMESSAPEDRSAKRVKR